MSRRDRAPARETRSPIVEAPLPGRGSLASSGGMMPSTTTGILPIPSSRILRSKAFLTADDGIVRARNWPGQSSALGQRMWQQSLPPAFGAMSDAWPGVSGECAVRRRPRRQDPIRARRVAGHLLGNGPRLRGWSARRGTGNVHGHRRLFLCRRGGDGGVRECQAAAFNQSAWTPEIGGTRRDTGSACTKRARWHLRRQRSHLRRLTGRWRRSVEGWRLGGPIRTRWLLRRSPARLS